MENRIAIAKSQTVGNVLLQKGSKDRILGDEECLDILIWGYLHNPLSLSKFIELSNKNRF